MGEGGWPLWWGGGGGAQRRRKRGRNRDTETKRLRENIERERGQREMGRGQTVLL